MQRMLFFTVNSGAKRCIFRSASGMRAYAHTAIDFSYFLDTVQTGTIIPNNRNTPIRIFPFPRKIKDARMPYIFSSWRFSCLRFASTPPPIPTARPAPCVRRGRRVW